MIAGANIPGPEIFDTYVPTDHLLDGNQGIAIIPDHPDFLLRWWPRLRNGHSLADIPITDDVLTASQPSRLNHYTQAADQAFAALHELGVPMPVPNVDVRHFMGPGSHVSLVNTVMYYVVRRYRGEPLSYTHTSGQTLIRSYTDYLGSLTRHDMMLFDIFHPGQHLLASSGSERAQTPLLIDIEPLVAPTDCLIQSRSNRNERVPVISYAAHDLLRWAGATGVDPCLEHELTSIVNKAERFTNTCYIDLQTQPMSSLSAVA